MMVTTEESQSCLTADIKQSLLQSLLQINYTYHIEFGDSFLCFLCHYNALWLIKFIIYITVSIRRSQTEPGTFVPVTVQSYGQMPSWLWNVYQALTKDRKRVKSVCSAPTVPLSHGQEAQVCPPTSTLHNLPWLDSSGWKPPYKWFHYLISRFCICRTIVEGA